MADKTPTKYPKTLTAPVDEATYTWFVAQADAADRTIGAHLRRVILAHREQFETASRFAGAAARASVVAVDQDGERHTFSVDSARGFPIAGGVEAVPPISPVHIDTPDDDPEEGVT